MTFVNKPLYCLIFLALVHHVHCACSVSQGSVIATDSVEYIRSANYPYSYPSNEGCSWTISTSSPKTIFFNLESINLESGYDELRIYDGSSTSSSRFFYYVPSIAVSAGPSLHVTFTSDYSIQYSGFSIAYMVVDRSTSKCGTTFTVSATKQTISYLSSEGTCQYNIQSASSSIIQLTVPILKEYNSVTVVEGSTTTHTITTAGTSTYVSQTNSIIVTASASCVFTVQEVASSVTGTAVSSPSLPTASICDTNDLIATSVPEYLNSPNYPSPYNNNQYCSITIRTSSSASVFVEVVNWDVELYDNLYAYDGESTGYNLLNVVWSTGVTVTSTGSSMTFAFDTSSTGRYGGFSLFFYETNRVIPSCIPSSNSKTASATEDTVASANFPDNYDNNVLEYTIITKPSETDTIILQFRSMSLEHSTDCGYDSVIIYGGPCTTSPILLNVCGSELHTLEDSSGLYILVQFSTDSSVVYSGFELAFYISSNGNNADASTDESTDENSVPSYAYGIVAACVVLIIIGVVIRVVMVQKRRQQVAARVTAENKPLPPQLKRRTTQQLLVDLTGKYGTADDKKTKIKRKQNPYHPMPNPPGPGTNIINIGMQVPGPPPGPPPSAPPLYPSPGSKDPVYPPVYPPLFLGGGSVQPQNMPTPAFPPGGTTFGPPVSIIQSNASIPSPFAYYTPTEAREMGIYGV